MIVSASIYQNALFLLLGDNSDRSRHLVREFLEASDKAAKKEIITIDDDLIAVYRYFIKKILNEKISLQNETACKMLLLDVRNNDLLKTHGLERDILTDILSGHGEITAVQIDSYLKQLRNLLILSEVEQLNKTTFAKVRSITEIQDVEEQEKEIRKVRESFNKSLKSIEAKQAHADTKGSDTYVSLSDRGSIGRALNTFMDRNLRGVIKTGLHGLNRALGSRGGFGLGETVVFAARSHNYKSGMLISIMIWTIIYNKLVVEPGKRAMVYFVSLENEVNQNLMDVFKTLYCRLEKQNVDINQMSVEFIENWLYDYFSQFDITLWIDRYSPHDFSFNKFTQRYNGFVDQDYQIILFDLDYMSEARGIDPGDTLSTQGLHQLLRENYVRFGHHAKSQGYLLTTGHQLNRKADEMARESGRYVVKRFNPSLMADSSDVYRTVDVLIFLNLENNVNDHKFLTAMLNKNRYGKDTPEAHKFFAYPFTEFGIEDDIDTIPRYVTDIDAWNLEGTPSNHVVEAAMF